jgi:hypothetical protein
LNRLNRETLSARATGESSDTSINVGDLWYRYEERAAIRQYDGGESRAVAETMAWQEVAVLWYREHGHRIPAHLCAGCHGPLDGAEVLLLPHGERAHADAGDVCIRLYGGRWKRQAAIALAAIGIPVPVEIDIDGRLIGPGGTVLP